MSIRDYDKIVTIQNSITGDVKQVNYDIKGSGLFSLQVKEYLLLQEIKSLIDNNIGANISFGFKKF